MPWRAYSNVAAVVRGKQHLAYIMKEVDVAKKSTADAKMRETRNERFVRLANKRVPKAIKAIELVRNLSGPQYEYTREQADAIVSAIMDAAVALEDAFQHQKPTRTEWRLPGT